jgi:CHAT domain
MPGHPSPSSRVFILLDIADYSRQSPAAQAELQRWLLTATRRLCADLQVDLSECAMQGTGDGQLIVLPPGVNDAAIVPGIILSLNEALDEANRVQQRQPRIRLRVALSQGVVLAGPAEISGDPIVRASRLLDSKVLRNVLYEHQGTDLALIVAHRLFVATFPGGHPGRRAFDRVTAEISGKGFRERAWILTPVKSPKPKAESRQPWSDIAAALAGALGVVHVGHVGSHDEEPSRQSGHDHHHMDEDQGSLSDAGTSEDEHGQDYDFGSSGDHGYDSDDPAGYGPSWDQGYPDPRFPGRAPGGGDRKPGLLHEPVPTEVHVQKRYLRGRSPERVPVGRPFCLLVSIVQSGPPGAEMKAFSMPSAGQDVLLVAHASGMRLLNDQRQMIHVPALGDSEPVKFDLHATAPGPQQISVTAWLGGSYLGELLVEITIERDTDEGPTQDVFGEVTTEPVEGAVGLVVRYDPSQQAYRFEFRDEDYPDEVTSHLAYNPGPRVERLIAELDSVAKGHSGYSAAETRDYLVNQGAALWRELLPERLRAQFWERQHRIRQLTILADKDTVPWELLYPMDPGHDAGFLVEQFPVTRAVFGRRLTRKLRLDPARFVLPEGSPSRAGDEVEALRRLLDPARSPGAVVSELTPLLALIRQGDFRVLHFACHNSFDPSSGSAIRLNQRLFTPTLMTTARISQALANSTPLVFINACRSAGLAATYNGLDSWAREFLDAGAAAFIGSQWAVCDGTARAFASELYTTLQAGQSLGEAVMRARTAASAEPGDPTWLAYAVYGDPRAKIS